MEYTGFCEAIRASQLTPSTWRHIISLLIPATLDPLYRRHNRRFPLSGSVLVATFQDQRPVVLNCRLYNASESGIMVLSERAGTIGEGVELTINLTGTPLLSHGRICHSTTSPEGNKIGIELDLSKKDGSQQTSRS